MAQVDKIQIGNTTYDILQSADAIFTGTSNDTDDGSATEWINVVKLNSSESNSSIFTKLSSMFKNIRYLYSKIGNLDVGDIGTSISDAINNLAENKADKNHTHDTSTLDAADGTPLISNTQTSDPNHVPSSLLVNNMNNQLLDLATSVSNKADVNHTHNNATTAAPGFLPKLNGEATKCLLGNGTWGIAGSTYANFSSAAPGLTPAAKSGTTSLVTTAYVLTGAGWQAGTKYNTDTTYNTFTSAANGLVPAAKSGSTNWATTGYVLTGAGWQAGTKYNTDTNTTYANFKSGSAGLVPAPTATQATSGYVLCGNGWQAGTKYNTDTTYNTSVGCYGTLDGTTLFLNTRNFRV